MPNRRLRCYAAAVMDARMILTLACVTSMAVSTAPSTAHAQPPTDAASPDAASRDEAREDDAGGDAAEAASDDDSAQDAHQPDQEQVSALLDQEARTRFQLGSTLYRQGRFDDAAREFRAAYEVSHRAELLYNLYLVERDAGHTREAADALRTYLRDAEQVPDRGLMEGRLAALDRQLAAATQHDSANDDGTHEEGAEGDPNDAAAAGSNGGSNDEIAPLAPPLEPPSRALPIALMAGGGAALAAGVVFAILAKGQYSDLRDSCPTFVCHYGAQGDIDALRRNDLIADISFGVGSAAVAAGVLVWLLQGSGGSDTAERAARVSAGCGADGCGLGLEGSF